MNLADIRLNQQVGLYDFFAEYLRELDDDSAPLNATLRVVATSDGHIRPLAASLVVARERISSTPELVPAGNLLFARVSAPARAVLREGALLDFLMSWTGVLPSGPPVTLQLQIHVSPRRDYTGGWRATRPCWFFSLYYQSAPPPTVPVPEGPFVSVPASLVARDFADATAVWLGPYARSDSATQAIECTFIDDRAVISDLALSEGTLTLEVTTRAPLPLVLSAISVDVTDRESRCVKVVDSTPMRIPLAQPLKKLEVALHGGDGFCFDKHYEDELRFRGATSVFRSHARTSDTTPSIYAALDVGEGERVEFKRWIPLDRAEKKSADLLKTVCAFSNTSGGDLYIGISDDLEIVGCAVDLARFVRELRGVDDPRSAYVRLVRRIVSEGLTPEVRVEATWLSVAGLDVLRLHVPQGVGLAHIVESQTAFIRRGANNKRATPDDILRLAQRADTPLR